MQYDIKHWHNLFCQITSSFNRTKSYIGKWYTVTFDTIVAPAACMVMLAHVRNTSMWLFYSLLLIGLYIKLPLPALTLVSMRISRYYWSNGDGHLWTKHVDSQTALSSLWSIDTIWRHGTGSTLAQVIACCLMAPSHCLNRCWLIISKVQWQTTS